MEAQMAVNGNAPPLPRIDTHQEALADVRRAYEITEKNDRSGKAYFMSWGTIRDKESKRGKTVSPETARFFLKELQQCSKELEEELKGSK